MWWTASRGRLVVAVFCVVAPLEAGSVEAAATQFIINGNVQPDRTARAAIDLLTGQDRKLKIDIELFSETLTSPPKYVIQVEFDRSYEAQVDNAMAEQNFFLRVTGPGELISLEDYSVDSDRLSELIANASGNPVLRQNIVLSTINERVFKDAERARGKRSTGAYADAFVVANGLTTLTVRHGEGVYYSSRQLFADILFDALKNNYPTLQENVVRIYEFENEAAFASLSNSQKEKLYKQFARAISQSSFKPWSLFNGHELWRVIDHCYEQAILSMPEPERADERYALLTERLVALGNAEKNIETGELVVKTLGLPELGDSIAGNKRTLVIAALEQFGKAIERMQRYDSDDFENYLEAVRGNPDLAEYWRRFEGFGDKWSRYFPPNSKTEQGKFLSGIYKRAKKVNVAISAR